MNIIKAVYYVFGAGFVAADIGFDIALAYKYFKAATFFSSVEHVWKKSQFKGVDKDQLREKAPLVDDSALFFKLTLSWLIAGALLQTCILIYITCRRRDYFTSLPKPVKIIVYLTIPTLMAPGVIQLYTAYQYLTEKNPKEIERSKSLIHRLRAGEIIFESIPQLATNIASISVQLDTFPYMEIPTIQKLSIATSFLASLSTITAWMESARENEFVYRKQGSKKLHSWCSLAALFLWVGCVIISGMTGPIYYQSRGRKHSKAVLGEQYPRMIIPFSCNIANFLFVIIIIAIARWKSKRYWKITRTLIHTSLTVVSIYFIAHTIATTDYYHFVKVRNIHHLFILNVVALVLQLLLGIIILSRIRFAALMFRPIIDLLFWILESTLCCESMKKKIVELKLEKREEASGGGGGL